MPKDYAKRVLTTSRRPKKRKRRWELIFFPVIFAGLLIYGVFIHKKDIADQPKGFLAHVHALFQHKHASTLKSDKKIVAAVAPEPEVHFDFYNQLPAMQITVPETQSEASVPAEKVPVAKAPLAKVSASSPLKTELRKTVFSQPVHKNPDPAPSKQVILSFGEFNNSSDAGQLRVSLLLSDCEAQTLEIPSSRGMIYRVQRGPFASVSEAKKLQMELQNKGFTTELKKV